MITANGGLIAKYSDRFNLSGLSKVSDGYTAGSIRNAVELVNLTCKKKPIVDFNTTPIITDFNREESPSAVHKAPETSRVHWGTGEERARLPRGGECLSCLVQQDSHGQEEGQVPRGRRGREQEGKEEKQKEKALK